MKKPAFLLLAVIFMQCEQVQKLDQQLYDSTEAATPITSLRQLDEIDNMENVTDKENSGVLLLKAWGSEPGWTAEFFNNRMKLLVEYGTDSLTIYDEIFENVNNDKGFLYHHNASSDAKTELAVKVENKNCTDASGETRPRKVTLLYKGKEYKGCGLPVR